jgi:hypothetical protein
LYDTVKWILVKKTVAVFDGSRPAEVLLLKSAGETGRSGADGPLNDVQLLVTKGGQVIYDYVQQRRDNNRFLMDYTLTVQDVTGDGVPEIIFHSGTRAASDWFRVEHILSFDRTNNSFVDITTHEFFESGTHGLRWLTAKNRSHLVVSKRGKWSASATRPEDHCHYCESQFVFDAYGWGPKAHSWVLLKSLERKQLYGTGEDALKGEWKYIQSMLTK